MYIQCSDLPLVCPLVVMPTAFMLIVQVHLYNSDAGMYVVLSMPVVVFTFHCFTPDHLLTKDMQTSQFFSFFNPRVEKK